MHTIPFKKAGTLLLAGALALAGCQGSKGPAGSPGTTGPTGPAGSSVGIVTGKFLTASGAPVVGATVKTTPLNVTATTGADGVFTIADLPIGIYSVQVSGTNVAAATYSNISVLAGQSTDLGTKTVAWSPIAITLAPVAGNVGFAKPVALSATVTGATGAVTYAWSVASGPAAGAFSDATVQNPTFTTDTFAAIAAGGKVRFLRVPERAQLIGFNSQQQEDATYTLRLSVNDGKYTQQQDVAVSTAGWVSGSNRVGVGEMVIGNDATAATYAWTLTGPTGSTAQLQAATTRNPYFFPDLVGDYTLANGTSGASIVLTAATFVGATADCGFCHGSIPGLPAKVAAIWTAYQSSAHGNFYFKDPTKAAMGLFAAGIDGYAAGTHYGKDCIKCHTTGYDPTAINGGFDEKGFTFPTTIQPGNFAALTAEQKKLGVIGCESCHGPLSQHNNLATAPKAFFNAEACGKCHDELPYHDRYELWSQSNHAMTELTAEATVENRGLYAGHCGRCHAAQGYAVYADQLNAGNTGVITKPDGSAADVAYLTSIGLTNASVEPQTCQACHDPHTTGLRIDGSKPTPLPAGFTVAGAGTGQVCMSCHNTRNGLHDDAHAPTSFSAPHTPSQTDVFMGKNAYFVGADIRLSKHASVADTCVGCHMAKVGADATLFLQPASTNHSFNVSPQICANCHSSSVNGETLKATVAQGLVDVLALAKAKVLATLPATYQLDYVSPADATTKFGTVKVKPDDIQAVEVHGQVSFRFIYNTAVTVTFLPPAPTTAVPAPVAPAAITVNQIDFQLGTLKDPTLWAAPADPSANPVVFQASSNLVKGMWNYYLVHGDGTEGIHNPSFALDVLSATKANISL